LPLEIGKKDRAGKITSSLYDGNLERADQIEHWWLPMPSSSCQEIMRWFMINWSCIAGADGNVGKVPTGYQKLRFHFPQPGIPQSLF